MKCTFECSSTAPSNRLRVYFLRVPKVFLPLKDLFIEKENPGQPRATIDWWSVRGSNSRPPPCHGGALPAELTPHPCAFALRNYRKGAPPCQPRRKPSWAVLSLYKEIPFPGYKARVARSRRFERLTPSLGGRCSIQLSYERGPVILALLSLGKKKTGNEVPATFLWSERRDLNPRPPGPEPGALPSCATSRRRGPDYST